MSLENSQYTFHTLQAADKEAFKREVDRITKEADHVDDDDEDEVGPPGGPPKRGKFVTPRTPARKVSGIVERVILENFLCHEYMDVGLKKDITFIVGRNGSGKSAILTGLVVALGGTASNTGRGAALKDFVRHGCGSGKVTCVISNSGAINFKREVYGDTITIMRTLQSQGGSSIKMRADTAKGGKVISSKMEELRNMTLALGIQVDNPISVLDQNTARHFLNQSRPSDKFELFMRATNLETLQNLFVEIALHLDKTNQELGRKERQLVDNNSEVLEAKRKKEMLDNLENDRKKGTLFKMELLWAEARDFFQELSSKQKELKKAEREKENLDSALASDDKVEPLLQKIESSKADIKVLENEVKDIDHEIKDLKGNFTAALAKEKKLGQEREVLQRKIKIDAATIEEYRTEIRAQEQKMLPEHVDKRRRQREEINELQNQLEKLQSDQMAKAAELRDLLNKLNGMTDNVDELKRNKRLCEDELRKLNNQLQGLEAEDSNMSVFGPCMPALMRQIDSCRSWKKKPIGPLGSYVRVRDPTWTLAVESVIKPKLYTFVVESLEDQKRLQQMIKQTINRGGPQPGVVRFPYPTQPYDTSRSESRTPNYSNVLDMVDISNIVARNLLIDFCKLESILLVPTDQECFSLLESQRNVPRNCCKAITLKGDSYIPAPNFASYGALQKTVKVLQTSRDEIIRGTQIRIGEVQKNLQSIVQNLTVAVQDKASVDTCIQQLRQEERCISRQVLETKGKLETLKDVEQPDTNSVAVLREDLAAREMELQEKQEALEQIPAKMEAIKSEKQEIKEMGSEKNKKKADLNQQIVSIQKQQKSFKDQIDTIQTAQATKKRNVEKINRRLELITKECNELQLKHDMKKADAVKLEDHHKSEALESNVAFESQSSTSRNVQVIDQELRLLNKKLASVEKTLGKNTESVEKDYIDKIRAYTTTKNYIIQLKRNAGFLKRALDERRSLYHTQKQLTCGVVSHQFTRVLRYRNCTGNVKINFEKRFLEITVGPIDEGERAGKGTSSLSGGERSFATMAFVIALWNVTELPFYYLDEFDVFMDKVNRQTVLTLLLRFAKQKRGYQFGFLTPLDTSSIRGSERVEVLKLEDPRK